MSQARTTVVEIETDLLEQLRAEQPGISDRELLEDLAIRHLGLVTIRRLQQRFNLSETAAMKAGVEAVHEARRRKPHRGTTRTRPGA